MARKKSGGTQIHGSPMLTCPPAKTPARGSPEIACKAPPLRERKRMRLRAQIIDTSIRQFRKRGYENTRVNDIPVELLEIKQPTFFRYFPTKDALLRDVGQKGLQCVRRHLETELSSKASTADRLRQMYYKIAKGIEADRPLWRAVVLSGAMDRVRSPEVREPEDSVDDLLREILTDGRERGEITSIFPVADLAGFIGALHTAVIRDWAIDCTSRRSLIERIRSAVEFFLRAVERKSPQAESAGAESRS